MTINTWSQLSKFKANLLELADALLTDNVLSKEEIALDLLTNIETLNSIEGDLINSIWNTKIKQLYKTCENKELERAQKRPPL